MASYGKVVLDYYNTLLRESDVALLDGTRWVNDNVIAFWFEYLENTLYADHRDCLALIAPQVVQFLKLSLDDAQAMFSGMDLSQKTLILLPLNNCSSPDHPGGTHWSLLAYTRQFGFQHYDSSVGSGNYSHAKKIAAVLKDLLGKETGLIVMEGNCIQQENGNDCGLHVICNADALCQKIIKNMTEQVSDLAPLTRIREARKTLKNLIVTLSQQSEH